MVSLLSFLGLLLAGAGAALAHYRLSSPLLGFYLALGGGALMALMLLPALLKLFRRGVKAPKLALLLGLVSTGALGFLVKLSLDHPLNDLSTDTASPPSFTEPAFILPFGEPELLDDTFLLDRTYSKTNGPLQTLHYPELAPLIVKAPPEAVFPLLEKALQGLGEGWKLVKADGTARRVELTAESRLFHFVDDVAVEARSVKNPFDTSVEIRSRSRFGQSDLGANSKRIEELKVLLSQAVKPAEAADAARRNEIARQEAEKKAAEMEAARRKALEEKRAVEEALEAGKAFANRAEEQKAEEQKASERKAP